jgi:hypothetical protein
MVWFRGIAIHRYDGCAAVTMVLSACGRGCGISLYSSLFHYAGAPRASWRFCLLFAYYRAARHLHPASPARQHAVNAVAEQSRYGCGVSNIFVKVTRL